MGEKRPELVKLSNQLIDVYVQDIFRRNDVDIRNLRNRLTDEQRENIRNTVNTLQDQVDEFLHKQNTRKKITENSEEVKRQVSPLRAKLRGDRNEDN